MIPKANIYELAASARVAVNEYVCTANGTRIASVFDSRKLLSYYRREEERVLPNVPMRAEKTLLADMLKRGDFVSGGIRRIRPQDNPYKPSRAVTVRQSKKFLGKLLGIEIEFYPDAEMVCDSKSPLAVYTTDGSLGMGGRELQKLTWVNENGRIEGLLGLPLRGRIRKDCGLHVHVDVRHLPTNEDVCETLAPELHTARETYLRLIQFYPMLKRLVPASRRRNSYCRWRNSISSHDRYCAINFRSFNEHGTIEFRCQSGSLNKVKIEMWTLLCQHLVKYAARTDTIIPRTWPKFVAILPEPVRSWAMLRKQKLAADILLNARIAEAMDARVGATAEE
jgi:hypothetical protein